jgi:hypothetical protein
MTAPAVPVSSLTPRHGPRRRAAAVRPLALVCFACAVVLVPWVAYLATSLPQTYVLANWNSAWVGFDVLLMGLLGATGLLARRQHPLHAPAAFASAAFLVADAWFDVMTSSGTNLVVSLASALLVELPLAAFLLRYATRATTEAARLTAAASTAH